MTVHSTSVTSTKIQNETIHPSEKRITGQWPVIFCPGLAATLPMLLLATLILYVIVQYRIDLVNIQEYPTNTYFFLRDISANIILSLTTCASILSLTLIPAMLTLASFLPSNRLLRISEKRELSMSPQTFDFALLIGVLYGSFGSYCSSIRQISKRPFKAHSVLRHTIFIFTGIILSRLVTSFMLSDLSLIFDPKAFSLYSVIFVSMLPHTPSHCQQLFPYKLAGRLIMDAHCLPTALFLWTPISRRLRLV